MKAPPAVNRETVRARPLNVGIVGVGPAGLNHARAALAAGHRVAVAAAASPASPRLAAFRDAAPGARIETGLDPLLADPGLDALIVALPWSAMPNALPRLLAWPKPMLIEKPLGLDAGTVAAAVATPGAKTANKLVGFNRRFYATAARMRARLAEGGLKAVHVTISEDLGRQCRAHGDAILPHLITFASSHTLDLATHLLGPLAVVKVRGTPEPDLPFVSINGLLETADGVPVSLSLNASDPSPAGLRFLFDDRTTWALSPLETLTVFDRYEIAEPAPGTTVRRYVPHAAETLCEPADLKPGFLAQMQAFLAGDFGPGATVEQALALQRFIDGLRRAAGDPQAPESMP